MQPNDSLKFELLKTISESRNAHGLRLHDPATYNQYCARRTLSIKKQLKFIQKNKKVLSRPITPELVVNDSRFVTYSLKLI